MRRTPELYELAAIKVSLHSSEKYMPSDAVMLGLHECMNGYFQCMTALLRVCGKGKLSRSCTQVASKLSPEDKATVERAVEDTIAWLDANQLAEVDEFEHKCARPRTHTAPSQLAAL